MWLRRCVLRIRGLAGAAYDVGNACEAFRCRPGHTWSRGWGRESLLHHPLGSGFEGSDIGLDVPGPEWTFSRDHR